MFRSSTIIRELVLNLAKVIFTTHDVAIGRQHRGSIIPQTVTHSLVLLKMGKIISRNMLS